ncbi:MAG: SRPBCC domain-containing protein [Alphaproteobacteria bacterium]|jgi:uncharacterized protein YndB with AHSA1/START domain|nr:SRPBCC domain-containing protein [Alphaproteobacteria bacterium]MBT4967036.1 SRPBCC domain-containing protein [Alphaproteobacteria bacterium]MBT5161846.1 SRPBCC domain-containing protein [Alphaproteobacteria bacterium]MBT5918394.1 SRPBCC domain-containing protein [Alphaproteobacteria bacterium]MBT6387311.1 SRPBCC domain-containing protein [Alphaproteobacteria bacterium]
MTNTVISKSIIIKADCATVWSFLTDKDKLALWFYRAEANLADGEDYMLVGTAADGSSEQKCWGTVQEMVPTSRLVYTFTFAPLAGALTTVAWTLEEVHGGTRLSLSHEGIEAAAGEAAMGMLLALDAGWDKHIAGLRAAMGELVD